MEMQPLPFGLTPARVATSLYRRVLTNAFVVVASLILSATVEAQSGLTDTLLVVDGGGQPIPYANISIKGGTPQVTDGSGLLLLRTGDDTLSVLARRLGFASYQGKMGRASGTHAFHITLTRNAQALNKVVVNETMSAEPLRRNGFYDRMLEVKKGAPTGEFFTPEDLEAHPVTKITDILYGSPYAKIMQTNLVGREFAGKVGLVTSGRPRRYIQGRAGCPMTLVLDGVVVHNMLGDLRDANGDAARAFADDRTTLDDIVPGLDVMAIEVYPSVATAPMSMAGRVLGATCGIVAIWTGPR